MVVGIGRKRLRNYVTPVDRFIVGVDLGQSNDPTAISVIHHTVTASGEVTLGYPDPYTVVVNEVAQVRFDVRHLERIPLGTPYPEIADYLDNLLRRAPLYNQADLVLDYTGVGRAVSDIFEERGLNPKKVAITAGNDVQRQGADRWHVPKSALISSVDAKLHTGELRFAANLKDAGALAEELKDFQRKVTEAGRSSFNAREGKHDDLILSIAIALWWAMRESEPGPTAVPFYGFY